MTPLTNIHGHEGKKYLRRIYAAIEGSRCMEVDVYCVLKAFNVTCPARAHAVKKLLCPGGRGKGSEVDDLVGAIAAINRAVELSREGSMGENTPDWLRDKEIKEHVHGRGAVLTPPRCSAFSMFGERKRQCVLPEGHDLAHLWEGAEEEVVTVPTVRCGVCFRGAEHQCLLPKGHKLPHQWEGITDGPEEEVIPYKSQSGNHFMRETAEPLCGYKPRSGEDITLTGFADAVTCVTCLSIMGRCTKAVLSDPDARCPNTVQAYGGRESQCCRNRGHTGECRYEEVKP